MNQKVSPFDTDVITNAANALVKHADGLGLQTETSAAALSVAAEIVRQRLSGNIQAMMLATLLTRK